jgi:hypothetical protein
VAILSLILMGVPPGRNLEGTVAAAPREPDARTTGSRSFARALGGIPPLSHWKGEGGGANFAA